MTEAFKRSGQVNPEGEKIEPIYAHLRDFSDEQFLALASVIDAEIIGLTKDEQYPASQAWLTIKHRATGLLLDFGDKEVRLRADSEDPDIPDWPSVEYKKYRRKTNPNIMITGLHEYAPIAYIVVNRGDEVSFMGRYVEHSKYADQKGLPVQGYVREMTFTKDGYTISQKPFDTIQDPKVIETFGPWPSN